ncbi:hypothetical protein [Streptomyces sp. NPDC060035]|uniref:hypothetical protein n=1 Tax=Streptomyces sp. NPDC060035 TaxID=3347044 RepID=UPI0036BED8F2
MHPACAEHVAAHPGSTVYPGPDHPPELAAVTHVVRRGLVLVLLYAQPLSRVVRLTLDDIGGRDQQMLLRLGEPPSPSSRTVR